LSASCHPLIHEIIGGDRSIRAFGNPLHGLPCGPKLTQLDAGQGALGNADAQRHLNGAERIGLAIFSKFLTTIHAA